MKTIKEMLEEEMEISDRFSKENFGLMVGDGFPELVGEVDQSDKLVGIMFLSLLMGSLEGKSIAETLGNNKNEEHVFRGMLRKHMSAFKVSLEMLYWGIRIGRRLQKEENASIASLGDERDHQF